MPAAAKLASINSITTWLIWWQAKTDTGGEGNDKGTRQPLTSVSVFPGQFPLNLENCSRTRGTHISMNLYKEKRRVCTPVYLMSFKCSPRTETWWLSRQTGLGVYVSVVYDVALSMYANTSVVVSITFWEKWGWSCRVDKVLNPLVFRVSTNGRPLEEDPSYCNPSFFWEWDFIVLECSMR